MNTLPPQFPMLISAGYVNRKQQNVNEYLQEEDRVLRAQLGGERLLFTDGRCRRLAAKTIAAGRARKRIGRKEIFGVPGIDGAVECQERLQDILKHYRRAA